MWEIIGSILTSAVGGGATGLLGVLLQRWFDHKKAVNDRELVKLQLDAARETRQMELEAQERMASKAADVQALQAQLDTQAREAEAAERSYVASVESDRATYSAPQSQERSRLVRWAMGFVDAVRGLMRPGITAYTLWMLTVVFLWVRGLYEQIGLMMTVDQVHALTKTAIETIVYLAVTTTVWWFGVRPGQPPTRK